jgi:AcrR family transcriptional regulator
MDREAGKVSIAASVEGERPAGPRSRKGLQTRSRLLEAAKEVFEENGFLEARISDIAERANLSHGSFYHYFESKDEIFREVARQLEEKVSSHCVVDSGLVDPTTDSSLRQRLETSVRRFLADYRDEAAMMGVIEQVCRYDEKVRTARLVQQGPYMQQAEEAIGRMQRLGLADRDLDPVISASALAAMVSRFAEMWFVQEQFECSCDKGVQQLTTLCMNALGLDDVPAAAFRLRRT